jgi:hypothetical protein
MSRAFTKTAGLTIFRSFGGPFSTWTMLTSSLDNDLGYAHGGLRFQPMHIQQASGYNDVGYVFGSHNELVIFRAVSDINFLNFADWSPEIRFFGVEILIAATHSPLEFSTGAATQ